MSNKRFPLGRVMEKFNFVIDGYELEIIEYHPWVREWSMIRTGAPNLDLVKYHCEEIGESADSMMVLIIAWITNKQLGWNQDALVCGIARMLKLEEDQ